MRNILDNTPAGSHRIERMPVGRPYLRLVPGGGLTSTAIGGPDEQATNIASHPGGQIGALENVRRGLDQAPQVLVAGASAARRAAVMEELMTTLPTGTRLQEAGETWEVLQQASRSRIVVLAGDHRDEEVAALVRVLGRRHPRLPVMTLGGPASAVDMVGRSAHA